MKFAKNTVLSLIITLLGFNIIISPAFGQLIPGDGDANIMKVWGFLPDPVLKIDDKTYSRKDFLNFAKTRLNPDQMQYITEKNAKNLTPKLISDMIENEMLMKCVAADGIVPSSKLVIEDMDKEFNALNEQQQQQLAQELFKKYQMNFDLYKKKYAEDKNNQQMAALNMWIEKFVKPAIKITDADIKKFYDESAEMIDASHIVFKPKAYTREAEEIAKKQAEAILARLKKGEKFEDLAKESACPNPDLGEFGRGKMVQEFDDAAFKLKPGEYSNVVKSPFGYHVIKLNSKRKQQLPPLKDVENQIKAQLIQMKTQDLLIAKVQAEKTQSIIENFYKEKK